MIENYVFLTSSDLASSQATKNRLAPFFTEILDKKLLVQLISPDQEKLILFNNNFEHTALNIKNNKSKNFLKRAIHELYISLRVCLTAGKSYKKIILTTPSPLLIFCVFFFRRKDLIVDIRDLTWEYLPSKNLIQKIAKFFAKNLIRACLQYPSIITVSNNCEKKYLEEIFKLKNKVYMLSNGISLKKHNDLSVLNNENDTPVIGYFGSLGKAQRVETLVYLAVRNKNIDFLICGEGSEKKKIIELAKKHDTRNLVISKKLNWEELKERYKKTNIFFAQLSEEYWSAVPSKLYDYLSTGKCLLFSGSGEAKNLLETFDNCFISNTDSLEDIQLKIDEIITNGNYKRISTSNKMKVKKEFIREDLVNNFLNFIN